MNGRVMKILIKGKVETVFVDQVKSAHFECEPEKGTAIKRITQSKTTNSKTSGIVRGTRKDQIDPVALSLRNPKGRELN